MRISLALLQAGMEDFFSYPAGVNFNNQRVGHTHSKWLPDFPNNTFIQFIKSRYLFRRGRWSFLINCTTSWPYNRYRPGVCWL